MSIRMIRILHVLLLFPGSITTDVVEWDARWLYSSLIEPARLSSLYLVYRLPS